MCRAQCTKWDAENLQNISVCSGHITKERYLPQLRDFGGKSSGEGDNNRGEGAFLHQKVYESLFVTVYMYLK